MKGSNYVFWILVVVTAVYISFMPYDETDDTINKRRSGMGYYVDYGTGCQYLGTWFTLTPRLGLDGKPMCDPAKIKRAK